MARRKGVVSAWSEYLDWLSFANAGMLARGNVDCFDFAMRNLPSRAPMLEIGSFCGLSTNVLTYLKSRHKVEAHLFTCDNWSFEGGGATQFLGDATFVSHAAYREFVKETFLRNVRMFSGHALPYTIEASSEEFFAAWSADQTLRDVFGRSVRLGGPISFCYIDGNHTYGYCRRDFENCDRFLQTGGFVLFDDSSDYSQCDVHRVAREVLSSTRYELIAKNPNYFFRKR